MLWDIKTALTINERRIEDQGLGSMSLSAYAKRNVSKQISRKKNLQNQLNALQANSRNNLHFLHELHKLKAELNKIA